MRQLDRRVHRLWQYLRFGSQIDLDMPRQTSENRVFVHALVSVIVVLVLLGLIINVGKTGPLVFICLAIGIGLLAYAVYGFEKWLRSRNTDREAEPQDQ